MLVLNGIAYAIDACVVTVMLVSRRRCGWWLEWSLDWRRCRTFLGVFTLAVV